MNLNTPQSQFEKNVEDDPMKQINIVDVKIDEILTRIDCREPFKVKEIIKSLINAEEKESLNGKWLIKRIYLTGSYMASLHNNLKLVKYIISQILQKPFKLEIEDRHHVKLVVLR